jgi:hypothetical protein
MELERREGKRIIGNVGEKNRREGRSNGLEIMNGKGIGENGGERAWNDEKGEGRCRKGKGIGEKEGKTEQERQIRRAWKRHKKP